MRDGGNSLLDRVIASVVESSLPMHLDSCPVPSLQGNFAGLISRSRSRWICCFSSRQAVDSINVEEFLSRDSSGSATRIVTRLLYRQPSAPVAVLEWISIVRPLANISRLLPLIHALLDVSACSTDGILWMPFVAQFAAIIVDQDASPLSRSCSRHCLMRILLASKSERPDFL